MGADSHGALKPSPETTKPSGMNTLGFLVSGVDRLILSQHQHSGAWNQALDLGAHLWITTACCTLFVVLLYTIGMS